MYDGEFEADLMHGQGTIVLANACRYVGAWSKGKMHGKGQMLFPTGDVYEGEWKTGKKHGVGSYTSANGSVYQGEFENGKRHGVGTQRSATAAAAVYKTAHMPYKITEGEVYSGEWKFGKRCGRGTICVKDQVHTSASSCECRVLARRTSVTANLCTKYIYIHTHVCVRVRVCVCVCAAAAAAGRHHVAAADQPIRSLQSPHAGRRCAGACLRRSRKKRKEEKLTQKKDGKVIP